MGDLGIFVPPKIIETRAKTLQPPERNDYHSKNFLSPPHANDDDDDDEFIEMQEMQEKQEMQSRRHHKRKEKGLFVCVIVFMN